MAKAELRFGAHGGMRELNSAELASVGGGRSPPVRDRRRGLFDINGSDWFRSNPIGRAATMSGAQQFWGFLYG